jgi:hypothetical protein
MSLSARRLDMVEKKMESGKWWVFFVCGVFDAFGVGLVRCMEMEVWIEKTWIFIFGVLDQQFAVFQWIKYGLL